MSHHKASNVSLALRDDAFARVSRSFGTNWRCESLCEDSFTCSPSHSDSHVSATAGCGGRATLVAWVTGRLSRSCRIVRCPWHGSHHEHGCERGRRATLNTCSGVAAILGCHGSSKSASCSGWARRRAVYGAGGWKFVLRRRPPRLSPGGAFAARSLSVPVGSPTIGCPSALASSSPGRAIGRHQRSACRGVTGGTFG